MNYYNEIDLNAAAWLRELIDALSGEIETLQSRTVFNLADHDVHAIPPSPPQLVAVCAQPFAQLQGGPAGALRRRHGGLRRKRCGQL